MLGKKEKTLPYAVTTERRNLGQSQGDYTIAELKTDDDKWRISIERKSIADLYGTLLTGRDRFERELKVLSEMEFAAVVVEGSWKDVFTYDSPFWNAKALTEQEKHNKRKTVVRSIQIDKSGIIYVGAINEFGFFKPDSIGNLNYHSLSKLLPDSFRPSCPQWLSK